jgi:hypothetical protein
MPSSIPVKLSSQGWNRTKQSLETKLSETPPVTSGAEESEELDEAVYTDRTKQDA